LPILLKISNNATRFSDGVDPNMLFSVREGSQERPKGHRRSSSYGSTGDTAAMLAPPMPPMGSLRHGQSYSEIPHAYDYQVNSTLRWVHEVEDIKTSRFHVQ
jgi:hypothetical protein